MLHGRERDALQAYRSWRRMEAVGRTLQTCAGTRRSEHSECDRVCYDLSGLDTWGPDGTEGSPFISELDQKDVWTRAERVVPHGGCYDWVQVPDADSALVPRFKVEF